MSKQQLKSLQKEIKLRTQDPTGGCGSVSNEYLAGLFDGCGEVITTKSFIAGKYEKYTRIRMFIDLLGIKITGKNSMLNFLMGIKDKVILTGEKVRLAIQFVETLPDEKPVPLDKVQKGIREIVHARFRVLGEKK